LEDTEEYQQKFTLYDSNGVKYDIPASKLPEAQKNGLFFR